ncbi:hypothetical protein EYC84_002132 [Monilinia fructicola]|uniref:Uncharacterized protein n=1 Tax=Monilinia fructicola TaxID=38448 RepID=A0A5M9JU61_MONFR|nr:hypothetical protein EYC84_002132 [Monilinia fructicola]
MYDVGCLDELNHFHFSLDISEYLHPLFSNLEKDIALVFNARSFVLRYSLLSVSTSSIQMSIIYDLSICGLLC